MIGELLSTYFHLYRLLTPSDIASVLLTLL